MDLTRRRDHDDRLFVYSPDLYRGRELHPYVDRADDQPQTTLPNCLNYVLMKALLAQPFDPVVLTAACYRRAGHWAVYEAILTWPSVGGKMKMMKPMD